MKRLARGVAIGAAVLVALIAAAVLALPYLLDLPRVQALVAASASQALGRPVRFASMSVHLLPAPRIELHDLEVAEDSRFGTAPFVTLERGRMPLRLRPLLGGRLEFAELELERPRIRLVEGADGSFNIWSLGVVREAARRLTPPPGGRESHGKGTVAGTSLLASGIAIEKGTVTVVFRSPEAGERRLVDVDLRLHGDGASLAAAGRGVLMPGGVAIRLAEGRLTLRGARSLMDASLGGQMSFEGADLGVLDPVVAPLGLRLSGPARGTLGLGGTLRAPHAAGQVVVARALVSRTTPACQPPERPLAVEGIAAATRWTERTLLGRPISARVADGEVSANLSVGLDPERRIALSEITVRGLHLQPLLVDFLCHGYAVTGRLNLAGALAIGPGGAPASLSGDGRFDIGRGRVVGRRALTLFGDVARGIDLAAAALGEEAPSPFEFDSITGSYRIRDGVAATRDLRFAGRGFTVAASGDYDMGSGGLDVDLSVQHGRERMRARVTGTADAPVLQVSVLGAMREVDRRALGRGLQDILRRLR